MELSAATVPRTGVGLDTRSYLIQAPRPNGESERAQLKVAFTKQSESFMTRFRPGQVDETEADASGGGAEAEPRYAVPELPDDLVFYSWWNEEVATPPELQRSASGCAVLRSGVTPRSFRTGRDPTWLQPHHTRRTPRDHPTRSSLERWRLHERSS